MSIRPKSSSGAISVLRTRWHITARPRYSTWSVGRAIDSNGRQGRQFTSPAVVKVLAAREISMDSKGAWRDNVILTDGLLAGDRLATADHPTRPPFTHPVARHQMRDCLPLSAGRHHFFSKGPSTPYCRASRWPTSASDGHSRFPGPSADAFRAAVAPTTHLTDEIGCLADPRLATDAPHKCPLQRLNGLDPMQLRDWRLTRSPHVQASVTLFSCTEMLSKRQTIRLPDTDSHNGKYGEPAGVRTQDLLIKSQLLYRLSYRLTLWRSLQTIFLSVKAECR